MSMSNKLFVHYNTIYIRATLIAVSKVSNCASYVYKSEINFMKTSPKRISKI